MDILVPDRAAFDRLEAEFGALAQSSLIRGLTRCALPGSGESSALVVRAKPSGLPVVMYFGRLDDASAAELQEPGNEGALLSALGIVVRPDFDCQPSQQ
ncbi:hypothetical protein [Tabrizicola sp.]|uniref:hypothetical protein n=1 Tax=Tabrizicola sp. TaxID=2005166 RepID=UPI002FDC92CE